MRNTNTKAIDPKIYQGKHRIYRPVPGAPRVSVLYVWDEAIKEYGSPPFGKRYMARRYEAAPEWKRKRAVQFFEKLEDARAWQAGLEPREPLMSQEARTEKSGPLFREIVADWRERCYPRFAEGTRTAYDKMLRLYIQSLMDIPIQEITPKRLDLWLDELKKASAKSNKRKNFKHELKLLSAIFAYCHSYYDDLEFQSPIRFRHREAAREGKRKQTPPKDLPRDEFEKFREELSKGIEGGLYAALATVQYFQALRISEAAGIYWEDVRLNESEPQKSRLRIQRIVVWPREKNSPSHVREGFKNAKANDGMKEQPLFPESYGALKALQRPGASGLVFGLKGKHLEYRQIQKINFSNVFAGQKVGIREVDDKIWLVSFMTYDLGYFDEDSCRVEPMAENPFGAKVLTM